MKMTTLSVAMGCVLVGQALLAAETETLTDVVVEAEGQSSPAVDVESMGRADQGIPVDAADLLRDITGVSGARMGGHGIEPIIRGQSQTRLNVILDGAYIHGGCPNRMDPPTAYSAMESYASVTVIKGSQTVIYGGGGSGGTVLFERGVPVFDADRQYTGRVDAGYKNNAETKEFSADLAVGGEKGFARGVLGYQDAGNYEDGAGNEVRSAFRNRSGNLILGYTPGPDTLLQVNVEATREDDVLFPGAKMDAPDSQADNLRLKFEHQAPLGPFAGVRAEVYDTRVDHLMDNYSLRPLAGPMRMKTPSSSDTTGGRVLGDLMLGDKTLTVGLDMQNNDRDAERFSGPDGTDPSTLQAILWPGAELDQTGVFAELSIPVGVADGIKAGLRYDHVRASISRGDEKPALGPSPTPDALYAQYYTDTSDAATEDNLGGFLRYEHAITFGTLSAGASRSVRTADATERYIASFSRNMSTGSVSDWVGNPDIDPEHHHQLEVDLDWARGAWRTAVSVYYDRVTDYILQDKARGQDGTLVPVPAAAGTSTIYRNVGARFYGIELEGGYTLSEHLSARAGLAYVNAENTTDDRPIAQIAPLEMTLGLDYAVGAWTLGGTLTADARQTRADLADGSGQDLQETPGWATLDLFGAYRFHRNLEMRFGVDNLLDREYAYHINRPSPFEPAATLVNEPGREVWAKLSVTF